MITPPLAQQVAYGCILLWNCTKGARQRRNVAGLSKSLYSRDSPSLLCLDSQQNWNSPIHRSLSATQFNPLLILKGDAFFNTLGVWGGEICPKARGKDLQIPTFGNPPKEKNQAPLLHLTGQSNHKASNHLFVGEKEDMMLSEISQTQKSEYCTIPLIWGTQSNQLHGDRK